MLRKLYPGELNGRKKADIMWGHTVAELIQHRGYGSTQPLPEYADGGNHEENRRVEMRLLEVQIRSVHHAQARMRTHARAQIFN